MVDGAAVDVPLQFGGEYQLGTQAVWLSPTEVIETMPLLHIQQIYTEWTDRPETAERRAGFKSPTTYPVPYFEPSKKAGEFQAIRFLEQDSFQVSQAMRKLDPKPMFSLGGMVVHEREPRLFVDFQWSKDQVGFPEREGESGFFIMTGHWGQIRYNGWVENEDIPGTKIFRSQTFNILYDAPLLKNSFTAKKPYATLDLTVEL